MAKEIFIPINRKRMVVMTVFYILCGIGGLLVVYYLGENQDWISSTVFKVLSVIVFLFFIIVAGTFGKNLKNKSAGLKIDYSGIDDLSSSISHGFIKWADIKEISKVKTVSSNLLLVSVKKPQKYIDKAKNSAIKRLLNQNVALYKTPVVINVGVLTVSLTELEKLIMDYSGRFGETE